MDYSELKSGFVEYLKSKYKTSRLNPNKFDNLDKDSSIFLYANDFKQYLKKVNSENNLNLSLDDKNSENSEDNLILQALKEANGQVSDDGINNSDDLMSELVNSFLSDENVKNQVDTDGDGSLSSDEVDEFFAKNNTDKSSLTFDDLTKLYNSIQGESSSLINPQDSAQTPDASSAGASSSSGGSVSNGGGGGDDYNASGDNSAGTPETSADSATTKSIENMSEEELNSQLQKTTDELNSAQDELNKYSNGSEPDSKAMDEAYEEYTKALGEDKAKELEEKQNQIKQQHAEAQNAITSEITSKENEISTKQASLNSEQQKYDVAENKVNNLKSKQGNLEDASQNENLAAEIAQAEKERDNAKAEIEKIKSEIEKLKSEKENLEAKLQQDQQQEQQELIEAENEATAGDEELKKLQEKYDTEKANYDSAKEEGIKKAKDEIESKNSEISAIEAQKQKLKDNADMDKKYPTKNDAGDIPKDVLTALDNKLGAGFCDRVKDVAQKLGCSAQDLLAVMSFESGISPSIVNKSSGATGLIQFMPGVAKGLGTTTSALKQMSAVQQMDYVEKYLLSRKQANIPNKEKLNAGDVYSLVFLPAYANQEELCHRGGKYYGSNKGLDRDKDGKITKTDLNNAAWGAYKNVMKKLNVDIKTV